MGQRNRLLSKTAGGDVSITFVTDEEHPYAAGIVYDEIVIDGETYYAYYRYGIAYGRYIHARPKQAILQALPMSSSVGRRAYAESIRLTMRRRFTTAVRSCPILSVRSVRTAFFLVRHVGRGNYRP